VLGNGNLTYGSAKHEIGVLAIELIEGTIGMDNIMKTFGLNKKMHNYLIDSN